MKKPEEVEGGVVHWAAPRLQGPMMSVSAASYSSWLPNPPMNSLASLGGLDVPEHSVHHTNPKRTWLTTPDLLCY